jgi:hypothetical protein
MVDLREAYTKEDVLARFCNALELVRIDCHSYVVSRISLQWRNNQLFCCASCLAPCSDWAVRKRFLHSAS